MDTVTAFSPLCQLDQIPDDGAIAVDAWLSCGDAAAEAVSLILLRRGEHVQGYLNICPHSGRRLDYAPGKFLLKHETLICAVHGATFHQESGMCIAGPCRGQHLRAVKVRVTDGIVEWVPRM
ncbi:MAG: Rieske 2Fe-2S domain-containing protein [Rhodanobacter sp.]|jgi:nitrite reductase/ring-hydroxylating ferredoxin subunit|nr:Rieske 2Fe-2S domain-containing protein [Rhodanobacter sp.]